MNFENDISDEKYLEINSKLLLTDIYNLCSYIWNKIDNNVYENKNIYPIEYIKFIDDMMIFVYMDFTSCTIPMSEIKNNIIIRKTILACYPTLKTIQNILFENENSKNNIAYKSINNILSNRIITIESIIQLFSNIIYFTCTEYLYLNYNYNAAFEKIIFISFSKNYEVLNYYNDLLKQNVFKF